MKKLAKRKIILNLGIIGLLGLICLFLIQCNKNDDIIQNDINNTVTEINNMQTSDDKIMNPGPDPLFVDYDENDGRTNLRVGNPFVVKAGSAWERYMYIDKTDTIYSNTTATKRLAKYLKKYGFTGVYLYSTSGILSSTSNYTNFSNFIKTLSDSGIVYKSVVSGSATAFQSTGNVTKYNISQTDSYRKINRANLELEWWNNASSWSTWNTINQQVDAGTISDNDFYEGWYLNMGGTIDTVAARDQVRYSNRILLHDYVNGIPTYSYANAKSSGATGGRLDIIAMGARQSNKMIDLYIIISSENTAWGAANTFTGPALASASSQSNPYEYIETQAYNNIYGGMTTFQKQWIRFRGFVWFTKRFCYAAIPPQ
jgi:hypothetical protein